MDSNDKYVVPDKLCVENLIAKIVDYRKLSKNSLEVIDKSITEIKLAELNNAQVILEEEPPVIWSNTEPVEIKSCEELKKKYDHLKNEIKNVKEVRNIMKHPKFVSLQSYMKDKEIK